MPPSHRRPLCVARDGFIRASIDELLSIPIVHLMSGVDLEPGVPAGACGRPTTLSGYTEWVSQTEPAITLGWDWCLAADAAGPCLRRTGPPRANVMLVNDAGHDKPWARNLQCLGTVVDALAWAEVVPRTLFR